ncbi:alpha/beta fold hydrolase [Thalassolituus sp.]|uniref:alpha/beta fold hydrolase n=1 Tax=Thalassolituus sp. TaxID=2030822 RepID=UPI002EB0645C|nr:alpha/beta fold hydrolase [Pseudomonadota bacterium]MEC8104015.1 alpha/beta fold hydrolase [Pseudomonadota bacterium]
MKSSSSLFPVTLARADILGDLSEDIYLVKHNRDPDQSVQVAVSRIGLVGSSHGESRGFPLVLVHGSFTNKGFWLSTKGQGMARYLAEAGFDVWLFEHRGHGQSPRNDDYSANTVERYARYDLPAVHEFIHEKTGSFPAWVGHSLGGTIIATAVAAATMKALPAFVMMGTQVVRPNPVLQLPLAGPIARAVVAFKKEVDGRQVKIGPENEPAGVINEYLARHSLLGNWILPSDKTRLMPAWQTSQIPLLGISGAADTTDPAKYCQKFYRAYGGPTEELLLGKENGFSKDYAHIEMVVSKDAANEVWPKVANWLRAYAS